MFKGFEEIKRLKWGLDISNEERINLCEYIEKELEQAEKDKEILDIFKNALTIKHTFALPEEKDHSKDAFVCAVQYLYEITQNDLNEKLRKSLREWVLKNAFPEELKRLEELDNGAYVSIHINRYHELCDKEDAFDALSKEDEKTKKLLSKEIEKNRALNEILALHDKWLGNEMSDFEFFTLLSEIKYKYGLSKI